MGSMDCHEFQVFPRVGGISVVFGAWALIASLSYHGYHGPMVSSRTRQPLGHSLERPNTEKAIEDLVTDLRRNRRLKQKPEWADTTKNVRSYERVKIC